MDEKATLHLFCGKMAAGKSTLAKKLTKQHNAILLVEDDWLSKLFSEEITDIASYVQYSARLKSILAEHILTILTHGTSVVLDFPGNTIKQRSWLRNLYRVDGVSHIMHYVDMTDEVCKRQLKKRSKNKPEGTAFTSDSEFDTITNFFQPPSENEGFNIIRYQQ